MRKNKKQIQQTAAANTQTNGILLLKHLNSKIKIWQKGVAVFNKSYAQTMSKNTNFTKLWDFCEMETIFPQALYFSQKYVVESAEYLWIIETCSPTCRR